MPWTYIVECRDGSYYVGSTTDLDRRIWQHNAGEGAAYTRTRRPVTLVWAAFFHRVDHAFAFEKRVQGWSRRKREALIAGRPDLLPTLASRSWAGKQAQARVSADGLPPMGSPSVVVAPPPYVPPAEVPDDDPWTAEPPRPTASGG